MLDQPFMQWLLQPFVSGLYEDEDEDVFPCLDRTLYGIVLEKNRFTFTLALP
jgi:hypothetical protein